MRVLQLEINAYKRMIYRLLGVHIFLQGFIDHLKRHLAYHPNMQAVGDGPLQFAGHLLPTMIFIEQKLISCRN